MPVQAVVPARTTTERRRTRRATRIVRARAPLRLGLAGGGTDVSPFCDRFGGLVLNATIDRYCYCTIEERQDARAVAVAADRRTHSDINDSEASLPLHAAAYRRICDDFSLGQPSLTITTVAEVPAGSGLGSSSTLVVSMVEAFREYFSLPLGEYEVARLAYKIEREDCGLQGGRQDQYAATFGGFNSIEFAANEHVIVNPLRIKPQILQEFEASIVLYYSGATRDSDRIIARQSAHVADNDSDRIDATIALKHEATAMKEALLLGDFDKVADVIRQGWDAKRKLTEGISTPKLDQIFAVAERSGALAGKVSGAGGGGYTLFLVDPLRRPEVIESLRRLSGGAVEPCHFVPEGAVAWRLR